MDKQQRKYISISLYFTKTIERITFDLIESVYSDSEHGRWFWPTCEFDADLEIFGVTDEL